ncbi:lytic murein transglycosylase [Nocardia farcinica]|nr:lytic murein transglycosylase [Nocardia farcinica]
MRVSAPITMSALVVAGLVASGSAAHSTTASEPPKAPEALLAASTGTTGGGGAGTGNPDSPSATTVGLLPVTPDSPRKLRAMTPPADGLPPFGGTVPLRDIALPNTGGVLGIPEIVLAAYRNAELALASSMPGCGLSWNLLAGIGRIESAHASSGRTDAAGTTVSPIFGPALDGTLPGNEIIKAADGGYVRAVGPMQFLPSTWSLYSADGNGDGVADPHNVFDASLAAGKYLCSGGLNLRDPQQELRAVLRYNNSMAYAADVLSWSAAYRTGGTPRQVTVDPNLVPPGSAPVVAAGPAPDMTAVDTTIPSTTVPDKPTELPPGTTVTPGPTPQETMIHIPGLPPIPCGIFCPPPKPVDPCVQAAVPAPMPVPGAPAQPIAPAREFGTAEGEAAPAAPVEPGKPAPPDPACALPQQPEAAPQLAQTPPPPAPPVEQTPAPEPATTPEAPAEPAPAAPTPPPPPGITLPFGIVIPLPPAPAPPPA